MDDDILEQAVARLRERWPEAHPRCGLILGSGWSDVAEVFEARAAIDYDDIPGLGQPSVEGHAGRLIWAESSGVETFLFLGRRHWYEGEGWTPIAVPVFVMKRLGGATLVLTNAAGAVRNGMKPGDLMVIDDHINQLPSNPLAGPHDPFWGPRFPDQTHVYDPALRALLDRAAARVDEDLHHGVYLASTGPTYETPAEIRAYRAMGADAVGMSTVPEAILANAAGLRVAAISCITNLAAGLGPKELAHEEVRQTAKTAAPRMKSLVLAFWKELADAAKT